MTITELRNKRARTWEAAKAFLDSRRNADGFLSADDDAAYTNMENEITALGNEISRLERLEAMDREMSMPTSAPLTEKPAPGVKLDNKTGRASDAYQKASWNQLRSKNPMNPELRNALQEGEVAEGGYLVPDTFEAKLIQGLTENGIVRAHARVITTSGGLHKIPVVASHGTASWIDEEGDYLESDEAFGQVQLDAHKIGTMIKVSEELLQDSAFNLESYIATEFSRRIGDKEDAFLNGDGSSKPTGILNATAGGAVGVTAAGAKTVIFGDLSYYWIGDRQGVTFRRLNELYAGKGQVGFTTKNYSEQGGDVTHIGGRLVFDEGASVEGLPSTFMPVANQPESAATTVAALKEDFNALLARLKAAGFMAKEAE